MNRTSKFLSANWKSKKEAWKSKKDEIKQSFKEKRESLFRRTIQLPGKNAGVTVLNQSIRNNTEKKRLSRVLLGKVTRKIYPWNANTRTVKYPTLMAKENLLMLTAWQRTIRRLLPLGGTSEGNEITIYANGSEAFTEMWDSISKAKKRVWLETYIMDPGNVAERTLRELTNAAKRGCDVRLIYDYVGSQKMKSSSFEPLMKAGAQVIAFNPVFRWPFRFHLGFFRNHKKILIIDDDLAFTGGMNIGDQYAGEEVGGNGFFRDTHLKVVGPAARDLSRMFVSSLYEAGYGYTAPIAEAPSWEQVIKRNPSIVDKLEERQIPQDGAFVQVLESNVRRSRLHIQTALRLALQTSSKYCYLTTPYFLPPQPLKRELIAAAKRGVDVRILTAGMSDVPLLQLASKHIQRVLVSSGVKIYELYGQALHAKTATIDGTYASVGSFNLDTWSYFYNLEINLTSLDRKMATELEAQFLEDCKRATLVTAEDVENTSKFMAIIHWSVYHMLRVFSANWFPFKIVKNMKDFM